MLNISMSQIFNIMKVHVLTCMPEANFDDCKSSSCLGGFTYIYGVKYQGIKIDKRMPSTGMWRRGVLV
jgi:hypothetical protein